MFYGIMKKTWAGAVKVVPENKKHGEIRGGGGWGRSVLGGKEKGNKTYYLIGRQHKVEGSN